ncbi:hypothetical protein [Hymenobacter fodinae]|uniref:Uncharacterized protein n=1 Tax=Hymenobacter fodinae TaxID=2510796 RepID=A0A4Z0P200_9BACT|nr:hypothetical protein [Hymenobacter fodinae]TGE04767.1 hypothetical protein EU556_21540 [Hymenobacter fodinae]
MKQLTIPRYQVCMLLLVTATACGKEEKQDDPQPAPTMHQVEVRYSGAGLTDLGAFINVFTNTPAGSDSSKVFSHAITNPTIQARAVPRDMFSSARDFTVIVAFKKVQGATQAPAGSYLMAEILVDSQVKKTVRIDNTTTPKGSYVTAKATVQGTEWH